MLKTKDDMASKPDEEKKPKRNLKIPIGLIKDYVM